MEFESNNKKSRIQTVLHQQKLTHTSKNKENHKSIFLVGLDEEIGSYKPASWQFNFIQALESIEGYSEINNTIITPRFDFLVSYYDFLTKPFHLETYFKFCTYFIPYADILVFNLKHDQIHDNISAYAMNFISEKTTYVICDNIDKEDLTFNDSKLKFQQYYTINMDEIHKSNCYNTIAMNIFHHELI